MAQRQNTLLLKRSNVIGKIPPVSGLTLGELAFNTADTILYGSFTSGTTGATEIREIGWNRIHRTGDTVTGNFNFFGDIKISGSSLPNGYALAVTGDTNLNGKTYINSGLTANTVYTDYIDFNQNYSGATTQGRINWDTGTGTLNIGVGDTTTGLIDLQVGQEEVVRVYNDAGSTLLKGEVVYVSGSQGNRPAVKRAIATNDGYSVTTLGMVDRNIAAGAEGYVTTFGIISNLNTLGLTGGTAIFLSPTVAGGYTSVKPQAPEHIVLIGYVVRVSATVGSIFINISNGWEIDELHDVRITNPLQGDLLTYSSYSGTPLWVNSKTLLGNYTISGNTSHIGNFNITGNTNQIGNFTITGNTTQSGSTAQVGNYNVTGNTNQLGYNYIVSATTGCTLAVTGTTCLTGPLNITGSTFMSGNFCMNNMNSTGSTGTNCLDTSLIPTGTTIVHQFQGEGGVLAHLGDLATGEPNSRGYVYFENNATLTSFVAVGTGNYTPVIGAPQTIGPYNNLFIPTTGATTATTNKLTYNYPPATGTSLTYLKYAITCSVQNANNQVLTFQIRKVSNAVTTFEPIGMTVNPNSNNASSVNISGVVGALNNDTFEVVVRNNTGSNPANSVLITDFTFSLFT